MRYRYVLFDFDGTLFDTSEGILKGFRLALESAGIPVNRVGSLLSPFFAQKAPESYADVLTADLGAFAAYFGKMLDSGIYVAPSQFEAMFVSVAHTSKDIEQTCRAILDR